jgi:hypothetical protein
MALVDVVEAARGSETRVDSRYIAHDNTRIRQGARPGTGEERAGLPGCPVCREVAGSPFGPLGLEVARVDDRGVREDVHGEGIEGCMRWGEGKGGGGCHSAICESCGRGWLHEQPRPAATGPSSHAAPHPPQPQPRSSGAQGQMATSPAKTPSTVMANVTMVLARVDTLCIAATRGRTVGPAAVCPRG